MLAFTIAATVQIGVFGSFHPAQLEVWPSEGTTLVVETLGRTETLSAGRTLRLTSSARVGGHNSAFAKFHIRIPDLPGTVRMERELYGRLVVRERAGRLIPVVEMDRETAVASIVQAEGAPGIPLEARKAQAIATRSYLAAAHGRHVGFDFCDNEHCQLLRNVPAPRSAASLATEATRGQVLTFHGNVFAALYSANCGGHTRTLSQAGWQSASSTTGEYTFPSVSCPLNDKKASGHGVGLCQRGAIEIARRGISSTVILRHFFPDTAIETLPAGQQIASNSSKKTTAPQVIKLVSNPAIQVALVNAGKDVPATR